MIVFIYNVYGVLIGKYLLIVHSLA